MASFRFDIQYVQQQESTKPKHRQNTADKLTFKIYTRQARTDRHWAHTVEEKKWECRLTIQMASTE